MRAAARGPGPPLEGRRAVRLTRDIPAVRDPAVAGTFYPDDPGSLDRLLTACLAAADALEAGASGGGAPRARETAHLVGILVPHAGMVYSGAVAAAAWRRLAADGPDVIVLLGTNHRASWLRGAGAWDAGTWATPLGQVAIEERLAAAVVALGPPFSIDRAAHLGEHSLEVQLPFVQRLMPGARIVPIAVSAGTGHDAIGAGERLGTMLAARRGEGERIALAISTDAAHYPPAGLAEAVNRRLASPIEAVEAAGVALAEAAIVDEGGPGLVCGMCGIEPTVLGLAALHAMGAERGEVVAAATSADVGAGEDRTVGYLAATFS